MGIGTFPSILAHWSIFQSTPTFDPTASQLMQNQLMQFLVGQTEEFVITRGTILMINSLCPMNLACYTSSIYTNRNLFLSFEPSCLSFERTKISDVQTKVTVLSFPTNIDQINCCKILGHTMVNSFKLIRKEHF